MNLYFFFSEKTATPIPSSQTYGTRVRELLEELAARSNGKLTLKVIDPQPFSEEEDRATELGVAAHADQCRRREALPRPRRAPTPPTARKPFPYLDPQLEEQLEYDVAKLIHKLSNAKKPVVGWLSSLPMQRRFRSAVPAAPRPPWVVYSQSEQLYTVRNLEPTLTEHRCRRRRAGDGASEEPAARRAVRHRPVRAARRAHAGVRRSGCRRPTSRRADPNNPMAQFMADKSSHLEPLLDGLGRGIQEPTRWSSISSAACVVSMRQGEPPSQHIAILGLDGSSMAKDVVTAQLDNVNMVTAGSLKPVAGTQAQVRAADPDQQPGGPACPRSASR